MSRRDDDDERRSRSRSRSRSPPRGGDDGDDRRGGGGDGEKATGVACKWNDKGYGFIKPDDGGEDLFCHFSSIQDGNMLQEGNAVQYIKVYDQQKGKDRAEQVTGGCQEDRNRGAGGRRENLDFTGKATGIAVSARHLSLIHI